MDDVAASNIQRAVAHWTDLVPVPILESRGAQSNTRMDAACAVEGGDARAMKIEIIQNPDVARDMAHARHALSR